jgi:hypothetical protein
MKLWRLSNLWLYWQWQQYMYCKSTSMVPPGYTEGLCCNVDNCNYNADYWLGTWRFEYLPVAGCPGTEAGVAVQLLHVVKSVDCQHMILHRESCWSCSKMDVARRILILESLKGRLHQGTIHLLKQIGALSIIRWKYPGVCVPKL